MASTALMSKHYRVFDQTLGGYNAASVNSAQGKIYLHYLINGDTMATPQYPHWLYPIANKSAAQTTIQDQFLL